MSHDLAIVNGTVVDGSGGPPYPADVVVDGDRITAVTTPGEGGNARRTIDADGTLVTPGFVDIHSHYDGQATWDTVLTPSSWHGVTTVVMGNCGVGFAPVRPSDHGTLIELMEGVEDIPGTALHEGLSWDWESFPDYLDALDRGRRDVDVAAQVPHGALRLFVMGDRGARREPASVPEISEMAELARQGVEAGALGFTTSRTRNHRTSTGDWTPTLTAAADELIGIARGLGRAGAGVLQVVSDFADQEAELATVLAMAEASGRPLSISVAQHGARPDAWRDLLAAIAAANARGLEVRAQVAARPVGLLLGLRTTLNPIGGSPTARRAAGDVEVLRRHEVRRIVLGELEERPPIFPWDQLFCLGETPDYEPGPDTSVGSLARRAGVEPAEFAYDHLVDGDDDTFLYLPFLNYVDGDLEAAREMLVDPNAVLGLADGGAHVGMICDGSFPTTMLTHWARDRTRGEKLPLEHVVAMQTARTARAVGLLDRGMVAAGYRADLNVIDLEGLTLHSPTIAFDLPAGGKRLLQRADGYVHTFVAGTETYAGGTHTGALPGRLVRGHQPAPQGAFP